jgi:flavin reductase (DIM6/NTAB) family NADH-FMN oxidoreductase RutF
MPVVLLGANVNNKPNFMPLSWISYIEHQRPMIALSPFQTHYTNKGIKDNQTFSINTPSEDMVIPTDYCGLISGEELDKSNIFDVFYGELKTAPMIKEAVINLECKVVKIIDTMEFMRDMDIEKGHDFIIGEIVQVYAEEKYLTNGIPDMTKIRPYCFSQNDNNYWKLGEHIGRAWSIGRNYK